MTAGDLGFLEAFLVERRVRTRPGGESLDEEATGGAVSREMDKCDKSRTTASEDG